MLMEFLQQLFALNLEWVFSFAVQNIVWVFVIAIIAMYVSEGEKCIAMFAALSLAVMAFIDVLAVMGEMLSVFIAFTVLFAFALIFAKEDRARYIVVLVFLAIVGLPMLL